MSHHFAYPTVTEIRIVRGTWPPQPVAAPFPGVRTPPPSGRPGAASNPLR